MSDGDYNARIDAKINTRELEDLIGSVSHLAQSLSHQESLRKRLTADVAHELRTPITSVQTHLEAIITAHDGKVEAESEMGIGSRFAVMLPILYPYT